MAWIFGAVTDVFEIAVVFLQRFVKCLLKKKEKEKNKHLFMLSHSITVTLASAFIQGPKLFSSFCGRQDGVYFEFQILVNVLRYFPTQHVHRDFWQMKTCLLTAKSCWLFFSMFHSFSCWFVHFLAAQWSGSYRTCITILAIIYYYNVDRDNYTTSKKFLGQRGMIYTVGKY